MTPLRTRRRGIFPRLVAVAVSSLAAAGCGDANRTLSEEGDRRAATEKIALLEREVVSRDDTIRAQAKQIQGLRGVSGDRLAAVPHAASIELASLTGGYDDDHEAGDDGVVVYFRPIDGDGDVIKAAGSVRIQLHDLANPQGSQRIGEYVLDSANLRKQWYGKLLTSHYSIKCPWRAGPPAHPDITVRVQFLDFVSGQSFERVKQVHVTLPPVRTKGG